jgi:APA family basic amino acid/polyamine antiporter
LYRKPAPTEPDDRPLGSTHVAAVVVGAIIGVGIFFTPAALARALPSPSWVLGIWLLGGIASVAGALVFAELAGRYPSAGGIYVFLREGLGPRTGPMLAFVYGWQQLLAVVPCSMAIIALVLMDHLAYFTGELSPVARSAGAIGAIVLFTAANLLGLRTGGRIQVSMASLKIAALLLLIAVGIGWGRTGTLAVVPPPKSEGSPLSWIVLGLVPVLFSFGGFQHGTFVAGSVRDAERAVPRGIMAGVAVVLIGYLGVNVAMLALLGQPALAVSKSPAADAVATALGPIAGGVLSAVIVMSAAGILNTLGLSFPFVLLAMARDGLFFERAAKLDAKTGRPSWAVAIQGTWACVAVLAGGSRIDVLLTGIAFADWTFHAVVAIVLLRVRHQPPAAGVLRAPLIATGSFLAIALFVAIGSLLRTPKESAYGAGVLIVGLVAWLLWRAYRSNRRATKVRSSSS